MEYVPDAKQSEAIALCCDTRKRVVAVTGEAGTGKTKLLQVVHQQLIDHGYVVALCAPTGKAAKRIKEATGINAVTAHRLLEYGHPGERHPKTGKVMGYSFPKRTPDNPLGVDVVLCDEYAMVNNEVHRNLLDALPLRGCIRMYGDVNQLSPIEENKSLADGPSPFQQMLDKMPNVRLETNYRQNAGSGIIANGLLVNRGRMLQRRDDFKIHVTDDPIGKLQALIYEYIDQGIDFVNSIKNQIITPTNIRWTGTHALNQTVQNMFFDKDKPFHDLPRHEWDKDKGITTRVQVGSKVICWQNIYDLGLLDKEDPSNAIFNGETGLITALTEFGEMEIDLGDRIIVMPPELSYIRPDGSYRVFDPRRDIHLAYAVTTHKSQGSEYDHVVYALNKSTCWMHNRQNTYTGITRARTVVDFIADQRSLSTCVQPERKRK